MEKYFETWEGKDYPVRTIPYPEEEGFGSPVNVAGLSLWEALVGAIGNGVEDAVRIDDTILFYCDDVYFNIDPSDEDLAKYVLENMF